MDNFFSIKEAVNKYISGCESKVNMPAKHLLIRAFFAGMMIAMGAAGSSVAAHAVDNVGLARVVAAVVFPVGLMMVILTGAELFTGDCLMVMATASKKHKVAQLIKVLCVVYVGNFVGAGLTALGTLLSGQYNYSNGLLGAYTIKVAYSKATMDFGATMVSGVLCNILVCLAVIMALCARDIAGKLLTSFFVIFLFVTEGFEHCVANMYYITAGILAKYNPLYAQMATNTYGLQAEQLAELNLTNFLLGNLVPVTIGNIIGGMAIVGIPLLYLNREKTQSMRVVKEEKGYGRVSDNNIKSIAN